MISGLSLTNFLKKFGWVFTLVILLVMFGLELSSAVQESQIIDEGAHLTAGYSYLINKNVVLNLEHPPLVKILAAFFVWPLDPRFPFTDLANTNQWDIAGKFFYDIGNNAEAMLFFGRLPTMLFSLLLGWLVFIWAKKIGNVYTGLLALALYAFDPNILAHSRYITTDIAISLCFTATLFFLAKYISKPSKYNLAALAVCFALAQITKFSALLLFPFILIVLIYAKTKFINILKVLSVLVIISSIVILLAYFFNLVPYYDGLIALREHERGGHFSYLLGQFDDHGFLYYFPVAFLVKTPLPLLVLLMTATIIFLITALRFYRYLPPRPFFKRIFKTLRNITVEKWIIISFPIFYFAAAMYNHLNIGIRHLLPIYPFLYIFLAVTLFSINFKNIYIKIFSLLLIAFFLIESFIVYPNYLSYFSLLIGGTPQGHKYLLDSNLDWGQDLKKLKKYLDENNIKEPIYLSYFGKASPDYYGINYLPLPENQMPESYIAMSIQYIESTDAKNQYLFDIKPKAVIGKSIYLFHIQK